MALHQIADVATNATQGRSFLEYVGSGEWFVAGAAAREFVRNDFKASFPTFPYLALSDEDSIRLKEEATRAGLDVQWPERYSVVSDSKIIDLGDESEVYGHGAEGYVL